MWCGGIFSIPTWISFKVFKRFWILFQILNVQSVILLFIAHLFTLCFLKYFSVFNLITISCIYLVLTPNSRSVFRAGGVVKQSFIHCYTSCETLAGMRNNILIMSLNKNKVGYNLLSPNIQCFRLRCQFFTHQGWLQEGGWGRVGLCCSNITVHVTEFL